MFMQSAYRKIAHEIGCKQLSEPDALNVIELLISNKNLSIRCKQKLAEAIIVQDKAYNFDLLREEAND